MKALEKRQVHAQDLTQIEYINSAIQKTDPYPSNDNIYKSFRKSPLLSFIKFEKKAFIQMFFFHAGNIIASLLSIYLAIEILATFETTSVSKFKLIHLFISQPTIWDKFGFCITLAFSIFFLNVLAASLHAQKIEREMFLDWRMPIKIMQTMYHFLLNMSTKSREKYQSGDITNIVQNDSRYISAFFSHAFVDLILVIIASVLIIYFMIYSFGQIAWLGIAVIILQIPCSLFCAWIGVRLHKKVMKFSDQRIHSVTELIQGMRLIRYLSWGPYFEKEIQNSTYKEFLQDAKLSLQFCVSFSLITNLWMFISTAIFAGYIMFSNGVRDASLLFGVIWIAKLFGQQVAPMPWFLHVLSQSIVASSRIKNFFSSQTQEEEVESLNDDFLPSEEKQIVQKIISNKYNDHYSVSFEFKNVYFKYLEQGPYILNNVSFTIAPEQTVAIVGPVGAGKTTLLKIFIGEYCPTSGTVYICINLKDRFIKINLHSKIGLQVLRVVQSYVPQEPFIVTSSIRENVVFDYNSENNISHSDDMILNSMFKASLLPDLAHFPDHLETEIGERGVNLSGGQKQRISLARKFYKNSKVVFLDDPFSAVDFGTEKEMIETIFSKSNKQHKTIIWTTHRLQHLSVSDKILHLENGCISEK